MKFKIMEWKLLKFLGNPMGASGWHFVHDEQTGDPIEFDTPEAALKGFAELVKDGYHHTDLKIVQEYPVDFKIEIRG